MEPQISQQELDSALGLQRFMVRVFGWMSFALALTGFTALLVASSSSMLEFIFGNRMVFFGIMIVQVLTALSMIGLIQRMASRTAMILFVVYSVLTGLTFSALFLIYTFGSISTTFFITAGTFAIMSFLGTVTKTDLTKFGSLMIMGLIGIIIASVINIFTNSDRLMWIITYAGVLIFTGLIAYDTQRIRNIYMSADHSEEEQSKLAIMGAFTLYLDFINLFLKLMRIFGRRR